MSSVLPIKESARELILEAGFPPGVVNILPGRPYSIVAWQFNYFGGSETAFGGDAHAIHYDLLWHFSTHRPTVRPFVAAGAGVKLFRGTAI